MCQLEGLVAAGKGVERMMGIARGEQAFRAAKFCHLLSHLPVGERLH